MSECYQMTSMCSTRNKIYAHVRTCTEERTYTVANNNTYKESMQERKGWQRTEQALLDSCSMCCKWCSVDCSLSLTSVLSRSITVSSLVGCESVEGGALPNEGSPACERNGQRQRKGTCHYMWLTLQEVTTHCSMWTGRHRTRGEGGVLEWLGEIRRDYSGSGSTTPLCLCLVAYPLFST